MEKEFVPYELALRLKALGFDEPCLGLYYDDGKTSEFAHVSKKGRMTFLHNSDEPMRVTKVLYQQAFRWFIDKYGLYSWIHLHNGYLNDSYYKKLPITWTIMEHESGKQYYERDIDHNYLYHTHEEAELACLTKLIEIVESNKVA